MVISPLGQKADPLDYLLYPLFHLDNGNEDAVDGHEYVPFFRVNAQICKSQSSLDVFLLSNSSTPVKVISSVVLWKCPIRLRWHIDSRIPRWRQCPVRWALHYGQMSETTCNSK